jgi:hydrogenase nickel incorporation protein HypB
MVRSALPSLPLSDIDLLVIENVGNLVCPAEFRVGEDARAMVSSVTEGEDKPLKYPDMFRRSSLMLLNKIDLLPHVDFDSAKCVEYARRVNPGIRVIEVSATKGQGMNEWFGWIEHGAEGARAPCDESIDALRARLAGLEAQVAELRSKLP